MKALEQQVPRCCTQRKAALDPGRVDRTLQVGDQVMLRTKVLLDAAEAATAGGSEYGGGARRPKHEYSDPSRCMSTGSHPTTLARPCILRPTRAPPFRIRRGRRCPAALGPAGSPAVEQLLNRKTVQGRTYYLARCQGRPSSDDSWEPVELLAPFRVA